MSQKNENYFRLGLFVLVGVALLIALTLIFGAGNFNKKTTIVETYVSGSVTGLEVGAPARYRGVKIGSVYSIALSGPIYERKVPIADQKQYVVIRIEILQRDDQTQEDITNEIENLVEKNLRARVRAAGITGVNYIEFDSLADAESYPELAYDWKPKYPVVPSLPSQADMVIAGVQKALKMVDEVHLADTQEKMNLLISNLNLLVAGDGKDQRGLMQSAKDLNQLINQLNKITSNKDIETFTAQASSSALALRQKLNSIEGDSQLSMEQIKQTTEQLNDLSRNLSRNPSSIVLGTPPPKVNLPEVVAK
jgi:phospholipid/cholesterol/gamma-HCH transport system substrate-binding protein/paraquat-inducible protein B